MTSASVTLKLSPTDFDLLREAITAQLELSKREAIDDQERTPAERNHARQQAVQLENLLRQLK